MDRVRAANHGGGNGGSGLDKNIRVRKEGNNDNERSQTWHGQENERELSWLDKNIRARKEGNDNIKRSQTWNGQENKGELSWLDKNIRAKKED